MLRNKFEKDVGIIHSHIQTETSMISIQIKIKNPTCPHEQET